MTGTQCERSVHRQEQERRSERHSHHDLRMTPNVRPQGERALALRSRILSAIAAVCLNVVGLGAQSLARQVLRFY